MKLEVVEEDCVISMIELNEMLESPSTFLLLRFDVVYLHGFKVDGGTSVTSKKPRNTEWKREG